MVYFAAGYTLLSLAHWAFLLPAQTSPIYFGILAAAGTLFGLGAFLAHFRSTNAAGWAAVSSFTFLASSFLLWNQLTAHGYSDQLAGLIALGLAIVLAGFCALSRRDSRQPNAASDVEVEPNAEADDDAGGRFDLAASHLAAGVIGQVLLAAYAGLSQQPEHHTTMAIAGLMLAAGFMTVRSAGLGLHNAGWVVAVLFAILLIRIVEPSHLQPADGQWPLLNLILLWFAVAIIATLWTGQLITRDGRAILGPMMQWAAVALTLGMLLILVRHGFHTTALATAPASHLEWYIYSLVSLVYAIALLAMGVVKQIPSLRYAGLAVLGVSIVKVFLFDMSHLTDLYRVLSFLGLGISLILLAVVYQTFVFPTSPRLKNAVAWPQKRG